MRLDFKLKRGRSTPIHVCAQRYTSTSTQRFGSLIRFARAPPARRTGPTATRCARGTGAALTHPARPPLSRSVACAHLTVSLQTPPEGFLRCSVSRSRPGRVIRAVASNRRPGVRPTRNRLVAVPPVAATRRMQVMAYRTCRVAHLSYLDM
eukprot:3984179-Prymnesium_polylepis.1